MGRLYELEYINFLMLKYLGESYWMFYFVKVVEGEMRMKEMVELVVYIWYKILRIVESK